MRIANLTQHLSTPEQQAAGVIDLPPETREALAELLTFDEIPTGEEMDARAIAIGAMIAHEGWDAAMIGGAPFFMSRLESACRAAGVKPLYAFSRRESVDVQQPDGSVRKAAVFRHIGFVAGDEEC